MMYCLNDHDYDVMPCNENGHMLVCDVMMYDENDYVMECDVPLYDENDYAMECDEMLYGMLEHNEPGYGVFVYAQEYALVVLHVN